MFVSGNQQPARKPFMEEYLAGTLAILDGLRGELEHVGELTSRAAHVIRSGGTVYASMNFGHLPEHETAPARRGNPGLMKGHGGWASTNFDVVRPGDMVFTNDCARKVQAARDRGAYIVTVTCSYINNEFRPPGVTLPNEDGLLLRDVANDILHSHIPYEQGLVRAPEIPGVTLCPSAGTGAGTLFWMLNAGLAQKLADTGAGTVDQSAVYLSILRGRVEQTREHLARIAAVAAVMARRVLDGGTWHVKSLEYPGLASELHYVECGPMIVNNVAWNPTRPNVLLVSAISPAWPDEVTLAAERRQEGAYVIAVGPASLDGGTPRGGRLLDVADVGFDNFSPESRGVIRITGRDDAICPTSSLLGNLVQQMLCAQWTEEMIRGGAPPCYFRGINQVGGREFNAARQPLLEQRGY
jgi:hypothetical protein